MWSYWRDKYFSKSEALKAYYPELLETERSLRLELIRIDAYQALIDKLMDALEDAQLEADDDSSPMWKYHRENYGYAGALTRQYEAELAKNEHLRIALENIQDAETAIDKWMTEKADAQLDED
jgi:hypothetical protein